MFASYVVIDERGVLTSRTFSRKQEFQQDRDLFADSRLARYFKQFIILQSEYVDVKEQREQVLLLIYKIPLVFLSDRIFVICGNQGREFSHALRFVDFLQDCVKQGRTVGESGIHDWVFNCLSVFITDSYLLRSFDELRARRGDDSDFATKQDRDYRNLRLNTQLLSQVQSISSCYEALLDEDYKPISQNLLESALEHLQNLQHELREVKNLLSIQQINYHLQLYSQRNIILRYTLIQSIMSTSVGIGSLIFAIFGMNFSSGLEERSMAFWAITVVTFIVVAATFAMLLCSSREQRQVYY